MDVVIESQIWLFRPQDNPFYSEHKSRLTKLTVQTHLVDRQQLHSPQLYHILMYSLPNHTLD